MTFIKVQASHRNELDDLDRLLDELDVEESIHKKAVTHVVPRSVQHQPVSRSLLDFYLPCSYYTKVTSAI